MRCSAFHTFSGPPALATTAESTKSSIADMIETFLLLDMTHLPPFDPVALHRAAHERDERLRVDRPLLRPEHPLVPVVEQVVRDLDVLEQPLVAELAGDVAAADFELALAEPDRRPQSRHRSLLVKEQDDVLALRVLGPALRRDAEVDLAVLHLSGLGQAELAVGVLLATCPRKASLTCTVTCV